MLLVFFGVYVVGVVLVQSEQGVNEFLVVEWCVVVFDVVEWQVKFCIEFIWWYFEVYQWFDVEVMGLFYVDDVLFVDLILEDIFLVIFYCYEGKEVVVCMLNLVGQFYE